MVEEWKILPGHPNYQVSNLGNVIGPRGKVTPRIDSRGYPRFSASIGGAKKVNIRLHVAVCRLFNGDPPADKPYALHNDHVKPNCRADNLRWGSHQDNMDDRREAGRIGKKKLSDQEVAEMRRRHADGDSQGMLGREFGVTQQYVGKLVKGLTRKDLILEHA